MTIRLIVNADDFNLTEGVSRGILKAHDQGIVTSTSFMVNLPAPEKILGELKKRKALGVGLHLNITLGKPISSPGKIPTLVNEKGLFKKKSELKFLKISQAELAREYRSQIERFRKLLGRLPTHLDTHHHLHEDRKVFEVFTRMAASYRIPARISHLCTPGIRKKLKTRGVLTTDYLVEDLDPGQAWRRDSLLKALRTVKKGTYELMCHPARCDRALMAISSFNRARERELEALCSKQVKSLLKGKNVRMLTFKDL